MTNFNDNSTAGHPVDLHLPETFHRLKRTVMLLSGALIVLAFTTSTATREIKLTLVDIAVATPVALWLLWAAAAYYLLGFLTEVRMARLLNSETILGQGMINLDKSLGKVARTVDLHDTTLTGFVTQAEEALKTIRGSSDYPGSVQSLKAAMAERLTSHLDPDPESIDSTLARAARDLSENFRRQQSAMEQADRGLTQLRASVDQIASRRETLSAFLSDTHRDLNRLSARISGDRKASFYFWEIGGAAGAFAVGTLLNVQSMAAGAKAFAIWAVQIIM